MQAGQQAGSARRRQRVIAVINQAGTAGTEISVSGIARAAAVDRTFLYRHRDLLEQIHALEAALPSGSAAGPAVTRASLQADLLAAHERSVRLNARVRQLEKRACRQQIPEEGRGTGRDHPVSIDQPVRPVTITRRDHPAVLGNCQGRQVPGRLIVSGHDARPCQGKPRHAP
jgi:hypothetical protein